METKGIIKAKIKILAERFGGTGERMEKRDWIMLAALTGIGVFLRLWNLGAESLRLDEAQSVWQASHSLEFIRQYMIKNVHLPLHNSLLHVWMRLFGSSEIF